MCLPLLLHTAHPPIGRGVVFLFKKNHGCFLVLAKLLQFSVQPLGVRLDGTLIHRESGNPVAVINVL